MAVIFGIIVFIFIVYVLIKGFAKAFRDLWARPMLFWPCAAIVVWLAYEMNSTWDCNQAQILAGLRWDQCKTNTPPSQVKP